MMSHWGVSDLDLVPGQEKQAGHTKSCPACWPMQNDLNWNTWNLSKVLHDSPQMRTNHLYGQQRFGVI